MILVRRVFEHREGVAEGFTHRYGVQRLVHFEIFDDIRLAIQREKTLKRWTRAWKMALIEKDNPRLEGPLRRDYPVMRPLDCTVTVHDCPGMRRIVVGHRKIVIRGLDPRIQGHANGHLSCGPGLHGQAVQ